MKNFETYLPTRLIFGAGEIARLGEIAGQYGKKALVVTCGNDMKKFGILDKALASLDKAGIAHVVFSDVEANPKTYNVDAGVKVYRENQCDMTVGLGGGSAMDAAKAIAVVTKNGGEVMDYMPNVENPAPAPAACNPIICVTTTAGTGAEATYFAVITNPKTREKPGIGTFCMMPSVSIIDQELMLSLPAGITIQTGIDVFFHAMEAYLNQHATPYTDMVSLEAMRVVKKYLPLVLAEPGNLDYRGQMAWANTLGGIAIVMSATCGLHAMGHSISGVTDIAHGRALTPVAYAFMNYTWKSNIERYAVVSRILGADASLSDQDAAAGSAGLLKDFLQKINMPVTLTEAGVPAEHIERIADIARSSMYFCMQASLLPLEREDVVAMLKQSV
jgi:alcohol dehydrogenase